MAGSPSTSPTNAAAVWPGSVPVDTVASGNATFSDRPDRAARPYTPGDTASSISSYVASRSGMSAPASSTVSVICAASSFRRCASNASLATGSFRTASAIASLAAFHTVVASPVTSTPRPIGSPR